MHTKISALVITYNEAKHLKDLIKNLAFADEIIIVDSYSTDESLKIIQEFGHVKVYQHAFKDFSSQRNIALQYASHEWILFIDADERITDQLKKEILDTVALEKTKDGYFFKRKFYFLNKPIHFSGLRVDKNMRLFKREGAQYHGLVHEKINFNNTGVLKNILLHYSYENHRQFKDKIIYYNKLKASEKKQKGAHYSTLKAIFHPIYTFLNKYIFRLGILDGTRGYIICKIYAQGIAARYKEMKKIENEQS